MLLRKEPVHIKHRSGVGVRSGLQAGGFQGCMNYCAQEYDRCRASGLPQGTCDDRRPVCQNACNACAATYY